MRLHDGIGRAFDTALHAEGTQPVAHQRGLARAQIAVQGDIGVTQLRQAGQLQGKSCGIVFITPQQLQRCLRWGWTGLRCMRVL